MHMSTLIVYKFKVAKYYTTTKHAVINHTFNLCMGPQKLPKAVSEVVIFLGEHAPRPP